MTPAQPTPVVPADLESRRRHGARVSVRRRSGSAGHLVVACILDEFSFAAFSAEADLAPLTMRDWLVELTAAQPDLLLVESAWRGHRQSWWNTVHRAGPELRGVLDWCRERGVPTAFWNKEDPVHFDTFRTTAALFDAVFTTDLDCVPRYKDELGHEQVYFLPFAAQPGEANPAEAFNRVDGCAFAGAYYEKYPERVRDLDELSDELAAEGRRFDIYDRNMGRDTPGYTFPERYRENIVGGALTPDLLDIPYKGYTSNLNLNSVKQSQSMFARRVFELLASNTLVISNYSRGLRLMFGDLVVATDSGEEMRRRLQGIEARANGNERLRAMALRKVLREHTYAERLEYIAQAAGVAMPDGEVERPLLAVKADRGGDLDALVRRLSDQSWSDWVLAVVGGDVDALPEDPRIVAVDGVDQLPDVGAERDCTFFGVLDVRDWHGPHYLEDLLLTFRWADVEVCGHVERFEAAADGNVVRRDEGAAWSVAEAIPMDRGLRRIGDWGTLVLDLERDGAVPVLAGLAVSPVEYCRGGAGLSAEDLEPSSEIELDEGLSLTAIRAHADALTFEEHQPDPPTLDLGVILGEFESWDDFTLTWTADGPRIESDLPEGQYRYWNGSRIHDLDPEVRGVPRHLYFDVGGGLDVMLVAYWLDEAGQRIGHAMVPARQRREIQVPAQAVRVRWGLRISGTGTALIRRVVKGAYSPPPVPLLLRSPHLVVSNIYPSYSELYRNGFVHSRLRGYLDHGVRAEVAVLRADERPAYREFEDIDVASLRPDDLAETLALGELETLSVHALLPPLWEVLKRADRIPPTTVWIHGFEIQPWWRRHFNYSSEAEIEAAKRAAAPRLEMWREVFQTSPDHMHFVFVSRTFAETVFEDLAVELPADRWSVIHNPIDGVMFPYRRKAPGDRRRILSIRPYASRVYANDLAVAAVLDLQLDPDFEQLSFTFIGDGPLFDETVEPLRSLPNVEVRRGFLTHAQIAEEHARHGILLVPSRSDTQGVSRDEAMSSGLVPVTSAVAAIPEFVGEDCGFLAPPEDHRSLADAIRALQSDPDRFLRMSEAAARRVRRQSGADIILSREMDLAFRRGGTHPEASGLSLKGSKERMRPS